LKWNDAISQFQSNEKDFQLKFQKTKKTKKQSINQDSQESAVKYSATSAILNKQQTNIVLIPKPIDD
jgi:hypothetical protein